MACSRFRNVRPSFVRNGRVVHAPVREEVPAVLPDDRPEPVVSHAPCYGARTPRRCASPRVHGMRDSIDARRREAQPAPPVGLPAHRRRRSAHGVRLDRRLGGDLAWAAARRTPSPRRGSTSGRARSPLLIGVLIVVGILALRFVRPERRNAARRGDRRARRRSGSGSRSGALLALDSVVHDVGIDALVELVVTAARTPHGRGAQSGARRARHQTGVEVQAQLVALAHAVLADLAIAGGFVDLAWVRHKRDAGDAIDPDTLTASAAETSGDAERMERRTSRAIARSAHFARMPSAAERSAESSSSFRSSSTISSTPPRPSFAGTPT